MCRYRNGVASASQVRKRGCPPILPWSIEENIIKLAKACDARADRSAGPLLARTAVGEYIRGTAYEKEFRERYPGSWIEEPGAPGIILPGKTWLKNFEKRVKEHPKYSSTVKCRGRLTDISKLRY